MATITVDKFKGLDLTTTPGMQEEPGWASNAHRCILTKGGIESYPFGYKREKDLALIQDTPFSPRTLKVRQIHDLENIFGGNKLLIIGLDYVGADIYDVVQDVWKDLFTAVLTVEQRISFYAGKFINYRDFVVCICPEGLFVIVQDASNNYQVALPYIDKEDNPLAWESTSVDITNANATPGVAFEQREYEWKALLLNQLGDPMVEFDLLASGTSTSGTFKGAVTRTVLNYKSPYLSEMGFIWDGPPEEQLRIYRRLKSKQVDVDGDGYFETDVSEALFYRCQNIEVNFTADLGDGLHAGWEVIDTTLSNARNFNQSYPLVAGIDGGTDICKHIDNRMYIAKDNELRWTRPGSLTLEDLTNIENSEIPITGVCSIHNQIVIQRADALFVMSGFPPNIGIRRITTNKGGTIPPYVDDTLAYFAGPNGIFVYDGVVARKLSWNITSLLKTYVSADTFGRIVKDIDSEVIHFQFENAGIFTWGNGWTYLEYVKSPTVKYAELTRNNEKELILFENANLMKYGTDSVWPVSAEWQTEYMNHGIMTRDKQWINMKISFRGSALSRQMLVFDENATAALDSTAITFQLPTRPVPVRTPFRARYARIYMVFTGQVRSFEVNANPIMSRR